MRSSKGRALIALVIGGAASLAVATYVTAETPFGTTEASSVTSEVSITGGTPEQRATIAEIIGVLSTAHFIAAEITSPPADFESDGAWLSIRVGADDPVESVFAQWQALLLAGLARDLTSTDESPRIIGKTITVVNRDGLIVEEAASVIDQAVSRHVGGLPPTAIERSVRAGANKIGLKVVKYREVPTPGASIVEVLASTDDAGHFLSSRGRNLSQLVGRLNDNRAPAAEGSYVEVRDRAGNFVTVSAYSVRTGEGVGFSNPKYRPRIER